MMPILVSPSTKPTPTMCPKLIAATSWDKLKFPNRPVSFVFKAAIATATKLQIIITNAVLNPQGSVCGIAAIIKLFNKKSALPIATHVWQLLVNWRDRQPTHAHN